MIAGLAVILALINLLCYYRSLSGYFLADDFVHVTYLTQVIPHHPELLLQNFYSNWMQTAGTQFYRPLISLTLAFDYLLWGANAFGFHLSNLLYQIVASVLLFLTSRRLLGEFPPGQAITAGFFAGALFAAQPLHPEVVSWIIGRVDSVCAVFFLAGFYLFLKGSQSSMPFAKWGALGAFALALLSKEMAVVLPATLSLYVFIAQPVETTIKQRFMTTAKQTWMFWALLLVYLGVRSLALGTLTGGYTGSVGQGLSDSFARRFLDGSLLTLLFPFNAEIFSARDGWRRLLQIVYAIAAGSVLVRLLWSKLTPGRQSGLSRLIYFAWGWLVLCLLPTYQVWNLTASLQGSRFAYLATAPLCLLLSLLIFPLSTDGYRNRLLGVGRYVAVVLLLLLVGGWTAITYRNNLCWAQAGKQVRSFRAAVEQAVTELKPGQKLVVLNVPQRHQGAHMIYNGAMLSVLLNPPLSPASMSNRVISFEPMTYGDADLLIVSRLKEMLKKPDNYVFCKWDAGQLKLPKLQLSTNDARQAVAIPLLSGGTHMVQLESGQILLSPPMNLQVLDCDFVDLELSCESPPAQAVSYIGLCWAAQGGSIFQPAGCLSQKLVGDGQKHTYRFAVSQHKSWVLCQNIERLALILPAGTACKLYAVRAVSGSREIPSLTVDPLTIRAGQEGAYRFNSNSGKFDYAAHLLPAAQQVVVEVSKPNSWFEHYSGGYRDNELSAQALKTWTLPHLRGQFQLPAGQLPVAGYYQVRLAALTAEGKVAGYVSDPVNLQISAEQIAGSKQEMKSDKRVK